MLKRKEPQRNWISLSVILFVLISVVTYLYLDIFPLVIIGFFSFVLIIIIWIVCFLYVLENTLREIPDFEMHKVFVAIKKIDNYENCYFLLALGIIFGLVVILIYQNFGELAGTSVLIVLYGFLFAWIRDILKYRRDKSS